MAKLKERFAQYEIHGSSLLEQCASDYTVDCTMGRYIWDYVHVTMWVMVLLSLAIFADNGKCMLLPTRTMWKLKSNSSLKFKSNKNKIFKVQV